jgi:hypothetical protein
MKAGPLSDPTDTRIPIQGTISFNSHLATSWAFLFQVGKASTHAEKVEMNTNRYLHSRARGTSVKSMIKFSNGVPPTLCTRGGAFGSCQGLFLVHKHITFFTYCLTYAGELGDIKMLGQGGLKSFLL